MTQTYDFPDHVKGDTFEGVQFTITVNSSALNLTGATIRMQMRLNSNAPVVKEFSVGNGLTLTTPASGIFTFNKQVISVPPGVYYYDIQITLSNGDIKTYITGTWTIIQDITHD